MNAWPLSRVPPWTVEDVEAARAWADSLESDERELTGESPALEQWRASKAAMAALDLEERRGELVGMAALQELLSEWRASLRLACDALQRRCGREAHDILSEAVADIDDVTSRWIAAHTPRSTSG